MNIRRGSSSVVFGAVVGDTGDGGTGDGGTALDAFDTVYAF